LEVQIATLSTKQNFWVVDNMVVDPGWVQKKGNNPTKKVQVNLNTFFTVYS